MLQRSTLGLLFLLVACQSPVVLPTTPTSEPTTASTAPIPTVQVESSVLPQLDSRSPGAVAKPDLGGRIFDSHGTQVVRATSAADGDGDRMRHEYSRRQAFNADASRYLAQDATGHWHLYTGDTFSELATLPELAGDCEPLWHPTDPKLLRFTTRGGGKKWWTLNVETGTKELLVDLAGRTPWPAATSFWTKGEGSASADGRILTLLATDYVESSQQVIGYGLVTVDLISGEILGTLDATDFPTPGALPDHVSTAASGRFAVASWLAGQGGTVAYSLDFTESRQLAEGSEHSDLGLDTAGRDVLVYADYASGAIISIDVENGTVTPLQSLYPAPGEATAVHISTQAFDRPGWAVVSSYADSSDYGATTPSATRRAEYRKIWLLELRAGGRRLGVAHTYSGASAADEETSYFLEPQASSSRDLSRIIFATDLGEGAVESYIVELPDEALAQL